MSNLILNSLEIRNFRAFEHLQIERLGRVNLIVGKNNVGKTTLLEAIQLYASRASTPAIIWETMRTRRELNKPLVNVRDMLTALKYLFYGRNEIRPGLQPLRIGPMNSPSETLTIAIDWSITEISNGTLHTRPLEPGEDYRAEALTPRFTIQIAGATLSYPIDPSISQGMFRLDSKEINCIFNQAGGISDRQITKLWDEIALTDLEKEVLTALQLMAPGLEGLNLVSTPLSDLGDRSPIVKIRNINEPLPLQSLGGGMQRIFGISLALVNARDGILLIDEFENGIHNTVQPDLWKFIFRIARQRNVQVFATTHSWDCIEAFQEATQENTQNEGVLIRLENKKGKLVVTTLNEQRLAVITREQIEVR